MGCLPRSACLRSLCLTRHLNLLDYGERLEIWDNQLCAIWKNLGYSEWSTPAGLKLARENLQSRVKEEDSITDVENAIFDLGVMDSLCFLFIDQRVLISMITKFIKFIELNFSVITRGFDIKVCMLKGPVLNSFRVNYIKVELLKEQNPSEQSRLRIFLSKEILKGGMIRIHSAFVHNETAPKAKSLASHISSNGSFQSGAIRIGASVRFFLRVLNVSIHSLEK
ncbi:hypothetical protein Tco_0417067 [Tanacetum coccineum]